MATRTIETVSGDEIYLWAKIGSDYVKWGCMDSFSFKSSKGTYEINCRNFSGFRATGKAATWTITTGGFFRIFNTGAEATNISVKRAYGWHAAGTVVEIKFGTEFEDDPIWLGKAIVTEFELNGEQEGGSKYNLTLQGAEPITIDEVPGA